MKLPKKTRKITLNKYCFILYFFSDKLSHYKTSDYRDFLLLDAFKHIRLQNTFNRCKVHLILPLMVDYACFLVKCINYQNVMCIQKIYFLHDLARFVQVRKILQDLVIKHSFLQESCKNAIASKNLARNEFFVRILQDIARNTFFCQLGINGFALR